MIEFRFPRLKNRTFLVSVFCVCAIMMLCSCEGKLEEGKHPMFIKAKKLVETKDYDEAAKDGPVIEEDVELVIPPPPQLGNRTVEVSGLGMRSPGRNCFPVSISRLKTANASAYAGGTASARPRC